MTGASLLERLGFVLAAALVTCSACAGSICEQAQDNIESCRPALDRARGPNQPRRDPVVTDECSGQNECAARCWASASCDTMVVLTYGNITDPNSPPRFFGADYDEVIACFDACSEE